MSMPVRFLGQTVTRKAKFMNLDVDIQKLTVAQVMRIQEFAKKANESGSEEDNIGLLTQVIREGAKELSEVPTFDDFPMDELSKLSQEIMKFSGLTK